MQNEPGPERHGGPGGRARKTLRAADVVLVAALLALSLALPWLLSGGVAPERIAVYSGGQKTLYALTPDRTIEVKGELGTTLIVVEDSTVRVTDSACPAKVCVRTGRIEHAGEAIACAPNGVTVMLEAGHRDANGWRGEELKRAREWGVDAVSR